jgi:hypothetical protein
MPLPLRLPTQLLDGRGEQLPDVVVSDHELFRALAGERNSFLPLLMVNYYYATDDNWSPTAEDGVRVLATLRNGAPLVVERPFGKGHVVVHLTKLSPTQTALGSWSNWSVNPVFPVLANELASYLSARDESEWLLDVGDALTVTVDELDTSLGPLSEKWRFVIPDRALGRKELPIEASRLEHTLAASIDNASTSGVYEVRIPTLQGEEQTSRYAVNVDAAEGDLALLPRDEIERRLEGARIQFHYADQLGVGEQRIAGFRMGGPLLGLILALLVGEQLLAYTANYHAQKPLGKGGRG